MPQLDKEIFIEMFFFIVSLMVLLQMDSLVEENYLRENGRLFLFKQLNKDANSFKWEVSLFNIIVRKELNNIFSFVKQ